MRGSAVHRVVCFVGLGAAALVGGHALGYAVAVPDPHHRAALYSQTGHGYLPSVSWIAVVLGLAALVAGVTAGYLRRADRGERSIAQAAVRFVPLQVGAFVLLELFERISSGAAIATFSARLMIVGVLTQALMAFVIALLVAGLRRIGCVLAGEPRLVIPRALGERLPTVGDHLAGSWAAARTRVRAPPAALAP